MMKARLPIWMMILVALPASAQQEPTPLAPGCAGCRIVFDSVVVLGDREGPGIIDYESNLIQVAPDGRFFVMSRPATEVKVFSADGTFLRALGGAGEGPGEFRAAQALHVGRDGRLLVADGMLYRVTTFAADGSVERTIPIRGVTPGFELFPLDGDSILLSGYTPAPGLLGRSVHVLSPGGEAARSFGEPAHAIASSRDPFGLLRTVARGDGGRLWIAGWDRYVIERWSVGGRRIETFVRDVPWFERPETPADGAPPPRAALGSIRQDRSGLLWAMLYVPAEGWEEGGRRLDTVIDVIDPREGTLLASARLPGELTNLFGNRLIGRPSLDLEEALLRIHVLRMRMEGR